MPRMPRRIFWAKAWSSARSLPTTWMSMGAGEPKFRIWLVMSAGRNEKVAVGYSRGSTSRRCFT